MNKSLFTDLLNDNKNIDIKYNNFNYKKHILMHIMRVATYVSGLGNTTCPSISIGKLTVYHKRIQNVQKKGNCFMRQFFTPFDADYHNKSVSTDLIHYYGDKAPCYSIVKN